MRKYLYLPDGYFAIADVKNKERLYAISAETNEIVRKLSYPYLNKMDQIPEEVTIPVFPISFAENEDEYSETFRISSDEPMQFQVNRIYWPLIQLMNRS